MRPCPCRGAANQEPLTEAGLFAAYGVRYDLRVEQMFGRIIPTVEASITEYPAPRPSAQPQPVFGGRSASFEVEAR